MLSITDYFCVLQVFWRPQRIFIFFFPHQLNQKLDSDDPLLIIPSSLLHCSKDEDFQAKKSGDDKLFVQRGYLS